MNENGLYVDKPVVRKSSITSFAVPTANAIPIANASAKRVRIKIRTDGSNLITVGQQNPLDATRVLRIATTFPELVLDVDTDGAIVKGNLFAQATTAAVNVGVLEVMEG